MSEHRLKMKIGEHEFEAEGSAEDVAAQFADFKQIIATLPDKPAAPVQSDILPAQNMANPLPSPVSDLSKIFRVQGRIVSLTALPGNDIEAVLLLLIGQKEFRTNEAVTGSELIDGLTQSGYSPSRLDRMMERFVADGLVIKIGRRRGTKYRLTNQGLARAQAIANELQRKVP